MQTQPGAYVPPGQEEDIDLIKKAYTAIELLLLDQEAASKRIDEAQA